MSRNNLYFCTNIYRCKMAAKLQDTIGTHHDKCGVCNSQEIYPEFMKTFIFYSCPICYRLAFGGPELQKLAEQSNNCAKKFNEQYCPLCGCQYSSLKEMSEEWIVQASEILKAFIGDPNKADLARRLHTLDLDTGCLELGDSLRELLEIMHTNKKKILDKKIQEAGKYLNMDLLKPLKEIKKST